MTHTPSRGWRHGTALLTWLVLAALGLMLLALGIIVGASRPRPFMTQAQIEQRGVRDGQARSIGLIQRVSAHSTTLGRLHPNQTCALAESVGRTLLVTARLEPYNACDPQTRLWVVELWGNFPPPFFAQPIRFIYTVSGDYVGTEGGPR